MKEIRKLSSIFRAYKEIKLVYFFGSRARQEEGVLSDYDFAVYFDACDRRKMCDIKLELFGSLSRVLKTDKIDIVILNLEDSPELKYFIIYEGRLIFQRSPFKVIVEPYILNEYFDFQKILLRYNLTKA